MKKTFVALIFALLCLSLVMPVLAQEPEPTPDLAGKFEVFIETLVAFVIASVIWALTGFFKLRDPKKEGFDPVQFFTTLVVGAVTGVLAFVIFETTGTSLAPTAIWQYLLAAGFVAFVESWIKVVWRRIKPIFAPPEPTKPS